MGKFNSLKNLLLILLIFIIPSMIFAQGVTKSAINGIVTDGKGEPLAGANVVALHEPSGTSYGAAVRDGGFFDIPNMRIGGPYTVTVAFVGYQEQKEENVYLRLGQTARLDFSLSESALTTEAIEIVAEQDAVLNSDRTGAATFINPAEVAQMPSVKRSTRDLTRLDPRSDGNFSFGGKNWLYNSISVDGSYFNNAFGLDDPAPGGQTNAEPIPFDAVEQVQVSVAPYDVREGGFTGAGINTVTKSGTNLYKGSLYGFYRNESLQGNKVSGNEVIANPDLTYYQSGFTASGPVIENELFFFINGEIERREDPGTNFVADRDGNLVFGESRVRASTMDSIRQRMIQVYNYDPGEYEGYIHETNNEKLLMKLDWNINENNNASLRYNYLDARRDLGPHPFVLSPGGTGRGPNENSLPFQNSGYEMNNQINSFAFELNSRANEWSNRFFASYNRFRDFRDPFSEDFPTIDIAENGVTYTTFGHEPFSIHNILDSDIFQVTNNFSYFMGDHVLTLGATYETWAFFNAFNIFRHGLFQLPYFLDFEGDGIPNGSRFFSLADFFNETDPDSALLLREMVGSGPYKGEDIDVGQFALYVQDEYVISPTFNVALGLRVDFPLYLNDLVANPFSTDSVTLLDENDNLETVDQAKMPDATPIFSPRVGFNWDVHGDRSLQLRGGTGVFAGKVPFVWIGNNISNPGQNPNLPAHLRSFDLNAMDEDFQWPQSWTTNFAVDHKLPGGILGTLEFVYSKDLTAPYVRNADLKAPSGTLPDGRPYFTDATGSHELNQSFGADDDAGAYIIDNSDKGYNYNITTQLRKTFDFGLSTMLSYSYLEAKNLMKSTEIASVLWVENPTKGDPNKAELGFSEFGNRHRIIGAANYKHYWDSNWATSIGLFFEFSEGNRFAGAGGNRYSFTYSGDVNGDGSDGNDLIYVPNNSGDIILVDNPVHGTAAQQWSRLDAFIEQDDYLKENRGEIVDRFGALNPWFSNIDLRILQDFSIMAGEEKHTFQLSLDILNVANLINSDWGVRQVASSAATSPLTLVDHGGPNGAPRFNFTGPDETYVDDPSILSRWRAQIGLRYFFN